jgi:hypothetical protein
MPSEETEPELVISESWKEGRTKYLDRLRRRRKERRRQRSESLQARRIWRSYGTSLGLGDAVGWNILVEAAPFKRFGGG